MKIFHTTGLAAHQAHQKYQDGRQDCPRGQCSRLPNAHATSFHIMILILDITGEPALQSLRGTDLKHLRPHIESLGGKVLLIIYLKLTLLPFLPGFGNGSSNEPSSSSWSCLVFSSTGAFIVCLAQMSSLWLDGQDQECSDQAHEGQAYVMQKLFFCYDISPFPIFSTLQ